LNTLNEAKWLKCNMTREARVKLLKLQRGALRAEEPAAPRVWGRREEINVLIDNGS